MLLFWLYSLVAVAVLALLRGACVFRAISISHERISVVNGTMSKVAR
jgi:hypothetical protein